MLALIVVSVTAGVWLSLQPALILRRVIDGPITAGTTAGIWSLALLYIAMNVSAAASDVVKSVLTTRFGQDMLLALRRHMGEHLERLPMSYYNRVPLGATLSRFTADVESVNTLFTTGLIGIASDMIKAIGVVFALIAISLPIGLFALCAAPALFVTYYVQRKRIRTNMMRLRVSDAEISATLSENFSGLKIIKAFGREARVLFKFQNPLRERVSAADKIAAFQSWFPSVSQMLRMIVIAFCVWWGASNGTPLSLMISVGSLAAIADLVGRLFTPIEQLAMELQTLQEAFAGLQRIEEFLREPTEDRAGDPSLAERLPSTAGIEICDAVFGYSDDSPVLRGASMSVRAGGKAALVGRTGAGKSTLMQLVCGLYQPSSGTVRVGGIDPFKLPPQSRRRLIGLVPQTVQIFDGTVHDAIALDDQTISREEVIEAAKLVGLHETIISQPKGYDAFLGEGGAQLSHGQTQLLSLARAVVLKPPVLLLDEMTAGLDARTESDVLSAVRAIGEGRTILTISHRVSGVIDADAIHVVDAGRVVESGTPRELESGEGWYAMFARLEAKGWKI